MNNALLFGLRVLVTRPAHQQQNFTRLLRDTGAVPISMPMIHISAVPETQAARHQLTALKTFDYVIFVSPNAVRFAHNLLPMPWQTSLTQIAAIGDSTGQCLLNCGMQVDLVPNEGFSSEKLLQMEQLNSVEGKKIAIVHGDTGRGLLKRVLTERGAQVESVVVYCNSIPYYSQAQQIEIFLQKQPQIVCITSNQGILNLTKTVDERFLRQLFKMPLIVNSERCSRLVRDLGFSASVEVASEPGDKGQIEALKHWYSNSSFNQPE